MKYFYKEESKSPKKNNKKDNSKLGNDSILWVGRIHTVKINMVVKEICSFNLIPIKIHKKKENPNTCIKPEGEKKTLYCQGRKKRYCRDCFPSFQDIL